MFILARYIIREHIGPFFFGLFIITFVFILNIIFRDFGRILGRGLGIKIILEFLFLNLAWIIALAVPMAVLIATLMAFGRLSSDNEITAVKASGVSFLRVISPALIVSAILAYLLVEFNNRVLPEFNHRARLLTSDIFRKRPTLKLEPNVILRDIPNYNLTVREVKEEGDSSKVKGVIIDDKTDPNVNKTIIAQTGIIRFDEAREMLVITLFQGEMHEIDLKNLERYRKVEFGKYVIATPVPGMILKRSRSSYRGDREKSAKMMLEEVKKDKEAIQQRYQQINRIVNISFRNYFRTFYPGKGKTGAKGKVVKSSPDKKALSKLDLEQKGILKALRAATSVYQQIESEMRVINSYERSVNSLMVEVHKKYSIPVACIVFVLVGAPLGIMVRRSGMAVSGGISLGFFLLYWTFLIGGEELADRRFITPFWAMWSANIIVGLAGIYLVIRTLRETTLISWRALIPKRWR